MIPYYPIEDSKGNNYETYTAWDRLVCEYTGLNILQVQQLDYIDYLIYRRDAFIYKMSMTDKGEEYLNNAWRLEQTEPDRKELRRKFNRREG